MPRFLLQIKELGKAPRLLPIAGPLLVGRSRRADVVVDDEEVGREQFRLVLDGPTLWIEGIGQTNRTTVDGAKLDAGQRAQLVPGAAIKVGRSTFVVQAGDSTEGPPARPGAIDATLVAPKPQRPGGALPPEEQTGGASSPMGTMQMPRPSQGGNERATVPPKGAPGGPANDDAGMMTMPPKAYRPGQSPSAPPPASPPPAAAKPPTAAPDDAGMMTMPPKAYRPGQSPSAPPPASPPPAAPKPPTAAPDDAGMMTMPPKAYRPGQSPSAPPPASPPPAAPKPPTAVPDDAGMMTMPPKAYRPGQSPSAPPSASPPASPPPAPAQPAASPPPPPPPPPAANPSRTGAPKPTTVLVRPTELPPVAAQAGLSPAELEARLHQSLPRLVVKGEGLKRRIRLMKLRSRIGRAETADVLLPHETVSEQHAELQFDGVAWHLVDSGSANGTLVDGALLRAASQPIQRHTLLGFGNLRAIFLCNDAANAGEQRAHERRAVQHLVKQGRLGRELAKQALQLVQKDQSQSLCEVLLMDTPIEAADWQLAIAATKGQRGLFARLLGMFSRRKAPNGSGAGR